MLVSCTRKSPTVHAFSQNSWDNSANANDLWKTITKKETKKCNNLALTKFSDESRAITALGIAMFALPGDSNGWERLFLYKHITTTKATIAQNKIDDKT